MSIMLKIDGLGISIEEIEDEILQKNYVTLSILRLDKIHKIVSGNKIFKLYYFLQRALSSHKKIITFGGAFSNHLAATAAICLDLKINCIGIIRGEKPSAFSKTLLFCQQQGMQLKFISKSEYSKKFEGNFLNNLQTEFGEHILIPEGGYSHEGVDGAASILQYFSSNNYTHICCAVGTGTTLAGLIKHSIKDQNFIGFSALRNLDDFEMRITYLLGKTLNRNYRLISEYHFGGFAKKTPELIDFMNNFYEKHAIPTDFIYTGKMMYGIWDLIGLKYFLAGSKILCIHTGGLQGNLSLPEGLLYF